MTKDELIIKIIQSDIDDETAGRMAAAMNPKPDFEYMSMRKYAEKFHVSKRTVERMVRDGKLPVDRFRRSVRIKVPVE